jgi:hypothetical protein
MEHIFTNGVIRIHVMLYGLSLISQCYRDEVRHPSKAVQNQEVRKSVPNGSIFISNRVN